MAASLRVGQGLLRVARTSTFFAFVALTREAAPQFLVGARTRDRLLGALFPWIGILCVTLNLGTTFGQYVFERD